MSCNPEEIVALQSIAESLELLCLLFLAFLVGKYIRTWVDWGKDK